MIRRRVIILVLAGLLCAGALALLAMHMVRGRTVANAPPPFVKVQDAVFVIDGGGGSLSALPEAYRPIGSVHALFEVGAPEIHNGESWGCDIGDGIYQDPARPDEVYVYTDLFAGDGNPRYLRFCR